VRHPVDTIEDLQLFLSCPQVAENVQRGDSAMQLHEQTMKRHGSRRSSTLSKCFEHAVHQVWMWSRTGIRRKVLLLSALSNVRTTAWGAQMGKESLQKNENIYQARFHCCTSTVALSSPDASKSTGT
jgi:hypothetical protein